MFDRCPACQTEVRPGQFTCMQCSHELKPNGIQLDALTYWDSSKTKRTFKYTATILLGISLTVIFHHIIPSVIGLGAAAIMYLRDYK
ncbi:hypothetical protein [Paenibacillus planticolens]|uniref:Zinc ribbon domain-containing protein n=1 Tax=Paenibacillus planticolens TaxID=2654976 RepID=A0ABX1ZLP4_9BACL|nr:hypothetical protein [Paenibacillus planticolens]NOV00992.1 hypothetical protein [Paenibacillus planticolens]